jgi:hypothetical protein
MINGYEVNDVQNALYDFTEGLVYHHELISVNENEIVLTAVDGRSNDEFKRRVVMITPYTEYNESDAFRAVIVTDDHKEDLGVFYM